MPQNLIKDGLLFIWADKECIGEVIGKMQKLGFQYVENLAWIRLDPSKQKGSSASTSRNCGAQAR